MTSNSKNPQLERCIDRMFACKMIAPFLYAWLALVSFLQGCGGVHTAEEYEDQTGAKIMYPNILFAISDDQSYPHASAYGYKAVNTPAFDRVAREGVLFTNAFSASPGCSPSRAAILTGMNCWQLEQAGTHASSFPQQYQVYPDILESHDYFVGYTQKGWGPGNWEVSGRIRNPAGNEFNTHRLKSPFGGISQNDYAANFADFLSKRPEGKPFCFWFGASEPHRGFERGYGKKSGKRTEDVEVPDFLPDNEEVRSDLLDYAAEIEWFDKHLGLMLELLEREGELENTIVVVTSDNGMAFPRGKANLYEYGFHVPLAIMWADKVKGGRIVDDIVNLIDLAPTYLQAAGIRHSGEYAMAGRSLMDILLSEEEGLVDSTRKLTFSARERHSSSRWNNLTYPQRCVRSRQFLYIRNFKPERWPAGDPQKYEEDGTLGPVHGAYHDIDASPTFDFLLRNREDPATGKYLRMAVDKRPEEEFYDILNDPFCLNNLSDDPVFAASLMEHRNWLGGYLMETEDPRVTGNGDVYETYTRYSAIRNFPSFDGAMSGEKENVRVLK